MTTEDRSLVARLKDGIEFIFKVLGFFLVTALFSGLILSTCTQSSILVLFPVVLILLVGFYVSLTVIYEPLLALLRKIFGRTGYNRTISFICMLLAMWGAVQIVISEAFVDVMLEYVTKLFPKALECENGALTIEITPDTE